MSCEHKYIYMETIKQQGRRPSWGISSAVEWKRVDKFYCEKCLDMKESVLTADGWEDQPDWY